MNILILSDLHLEFGQFEIPKIENEQETIVVLAGDIGLVKSEITYRDFINNTSDRFKKVIWILGNHEHYGCNFPSTYNKLWSATLDLENLYVLEKESVIFDNVAFICATLWTDFNNFNSVVMNEAAMWMNDYTKIRTGPNNEPWKRKLNPTDVAKDHIEAKKFIFSEIEKHKKENRKIVVVSHHLPSYLSISDKHKGQLLNGAYASELFDDIYDTEPDIWIHGHTHESFDYKINKTRVICNPRGYYGHDLNNKFDPTFMIKI